jgi:hypothetical protein
VDRFSDEKHCPLRFEAGILRETSESAAGNEHWADLKKFTVKEPPGISFATNRGSGRKIGLAARKAIGQARGEGARKTRRCGTDQECRYALAPSDASTELDLTRPVARSSLQRCAFMHKRVSLPSW